MPAFVLHGDSFLVSRRLRALEAEFGIAGQLDANRHKLAGSAAVIPELLSIGRAIPFLDAWRVVLVEGLLAAAQPRSGGGRRSGGRAARGGGEWGQLAAAIPEFPDTTLLLLADGPVDGNNPLLRQLTPVCKVERLEAPQREALSRWIKDAAAAKGANIRPAAIRSLADLVGSDLWTLDQELEKLSLYCAGRAIDEADVQLMVPQVREASIFNAVDAMVDGQTATALRLLHQLQEDGNEPLHILAMVQRQLRLVALAQDALERGAPAGELRNILGTTSDFVVRKAVAQARRHRRPDIVRRYHRLLETDQAIKQGELPPTLALDMLAGRVN